MSQQYGIPQMGSDGECMLLRLYESYAEAAAALLNPTNSLAGEVIYELKMVARARRQVIVTQLTEGITGMSE